MKKILLLLPLCFCLSGCTSILLGLAIASAPKVDISFKADGETFRSENPSSLHIIEVEGKGFAISYNGGEWDTENTLESVVIGLNCGFLDGELEKNQEYVFTTDDNLDTYPIFKHSELIAEESTSGSSVSRITTVWYNATDGWFKITKLKEDNGTVSGKFAFTAVCDDPDSPRVIEITEGSFRNIPFVWVKDNIR